MKTRTLILGAALVGAAALVLLDGGAPSGGIAQPVARKGGAAAPVTAASATPVPASASARAEAEAHIMRLQARAELIGEVGDGSADPTFRSQNWNPPPPPMAPPPPPPPPSAPPLPFTYVGKAAANGSWEVFLARGEGTYVVREKTVIDGVYWVESIAPPTITITYLPLNQVQQLNIGVFD